MNEKPILKYFTGNEADQFTFYRIPKQLFTSQYFSSLSTDAKVLYGLMLDRVGLSVRNGWMDGEGHAYIFFSIEDAMELLNCRKNKAIKIFSELDTDSGVGLIEKRRLGQGKPARIYVKNFFIPEEAGSEVGKTNFLRFEKQTSGSLKNKPLEVGKTNPNKNDKNNTEENNIQSYLISSGKMDDVASGNSKEPVSWKERIYRNIEYDALIRQHPFEREMIDELCELILETLMSEKQEIVIARDSYPAEFVKGRLLKLDYGHFEYILQCLKNNTTKVRNIRQYMLAVLFNAPATISNYYQQEVNCDLNGVSVKEA